MERGATLADHTLIAFGGAAPLHAARVAEKLGLSRVLIPADAGVGSAIGFLRAPVAYELLQSRYMRLDAFDPGLANALLEGMSAEATALAEGAEATQERRAAFMRYRGQGHEIAVDLPGEPLTAADADAMRKAFEAEYDRLFARHIPGAVIEILSWSVTVGAAPLAAETPPETPAPSTPVPVRERLIFDTGLRETRAVPEYDRLALAPGAVLAGPAMIVEPTTTTFVTERFSASVDGGGALILTANGAS